ncbi:MAG: ComEC/Rec2 family competence protein [Bdellovibrionaceae bacterium]|nr:ComEC/Rec2 family competence protein [Pseudobdellovibrionaceae bacterium]
MHKICLKRLNFKTEFSDIYKALVCGKRLPSGDIKQLFVKGGLIHLTVVSGAHLLFLEKLWLKIPFSHSLKYKSLSLFLILYSLTSQLKPPVLRALISFFFFQISEKKKLFWSKAGITLLSGLACLAYNPSWINSNSLQLSVLASLIFSYSKKSLKKNLLIYLFLLPILNRWQNLHPLTVLVNWISAPIISGLLFPLSFLSPFLPFFYKVSDFLWSIFLKILGVVNFFPSNLSLIKYKLPEDWTWFYILLIFFLLSLFKKLSYRYLSYEKKLVLKAYK